MYIESEVLELKEKYTDNIIKDFVLFLNTNGGEIYVGIKDNGEILGIPKEISKEDFLMALVIQETQF